MFQNKTFGMLFYLALSLVIWLSFLTPAIYTPAAGQASKYFANSSTRLVFDRPNLSPEAPSSALTIYVDKRATGSETGADWVNAKTGLQDALEIVTSGDQIWVATGIYTPTHQTLRADTRTATFSMSEGVKIYGGFNGNETSLTQRNWRAHPSILSGDLNGDDVVDSFTNNSENSYHVVTAAGILNTNTRLDGFTIQGGNANGIGQHQFGGGLYNQPSTGSPSLVNLVFYKNFAEMGGGLYNVSSDALIVNAAWIGNKSDFGGGIRNYDSNVFLYNTLFVGNTSYTRGGAIYNSGSHPVFINCTVAYNSAGESAGGLLNDKDLTGTPSWNEFKNCIIWGNTPDQISNEVTPASTTELYSTLIQGGCTGVGVSCFLAILDSDPLFIDPAGADAIIGTQDDNFRLRTNSPAIDKGENAAVPKDDLDINYNGNVTETLPLDLGDFRRFMGRGTPPRVDMGAYEAKPTLFLPLIQK